MNVTVVSELWFMNVLVVDEMYQEAFAGKNS